MAKILIVHIIPVGGGRPSVGHMFYGETETECRENFAAHAKGCQFLAPAIREDRIDEDLGELDDDEWPNFTPEGDLIDVEGTVVDDEDDEDEGSRGAPFEDEEEK